MVDAGQGGLGDVLPAPSYEEDGQVYLSWVEAGDGGTGAVVGRAVLETDGDEPRLDGLEVVWRQTPKVAGDGHFSHRLAFSPDGAHLFVSSGDRQLGDPAQDTTDTLGTIVRPHPRRRARSRQPARRPGWGECRDLELGPPEPARARARPRRHPVVIGDGARGRRRAQRDRGRLELRLARGVRRQRLRRRRRDIPDHADGDGYAAPARSWNPSISPGSLMVYDGELFEAWPWRRVPRRAVG